MSVYKLTREQLCELKENYLYSQNESVSMGELMAIDDIVSDETVFDEYSATLFTDDDFCCTAKEGVAIC